MNQSERARRQQVLGIVSMVYDVCEKIETPINAEYIYYAVKEWLDKGYSPNKGQYYIWSEFSKPPKIKIPDRIVKGRMDEVNLIKNDGE